MAVKKLQSVLAFIKLVTVRKRTYNVTM